MIQVKIDGVWVRELPGCYLTPTALSAALFCYPIAMFCTAAQMKWALEDILRCRPFSDVQIVEVP